MPVELSNKIFLSSSFRKENNPTHFESKKSGVIEKIKNLSQLRASFISLTKRILSSAKPIPRRFFLDKSIKPISFSTRPVENTSFEPASVEDNLFVNKLAKHAFTTRPMEYGLSWGKPLSPSRYPQPSVKTESKEPINENLGPLLKNPKYVFHSISNDISRLESIFEHGILSMDRGRNLEFPANYGMLNWETYNGEFNVSLSRSPSHPDSLGFKSGSFHTFSKKGISFVIKPDKLTILQKKTPVCGECLVGGEIPPSEIEGVMVQKELLDTPLEKIDFLAKGGSASVHLRAKYFYKYVVQKTGIEDQSLWSKIQKKCQTIEDKKKYENLLKNYAGQAFKSIEIVTLRDFLKKHLPENMKTYDTFGYEITL